MNNFSVAIQRALRVKRRGKPVNESPIELGSGHPRTLDQVRLALTEVNVIGADDLKLTAIRSSLNIKVPVVCLIQRPFRPGTDANSKFVLVEKLSDRRDEITFYDFDTNGRVKMNLVEFMVLWFGNVEGTYLKGYSLFFKQKESHAKEGKRDEGR